VLIGILIASFLYSLSISNIKVPLTYDIVGPKAFPLAVAAVMISASSILLIFQKKTVSGYKKYPAVNLAGIFLFYLLSLKLFGFMLATVTAVYMLSRILKISWIQGLLSGLILAISIYGLFHFVLGMPLPMGYIFGASGI
jgi:putative tricarboxylic transport membrane protein